MTKNLECRLVALGKKANFGITVDGTGKIDLFVVDECGDRFLCQSMWISEARWSKAWLSMLSSAVTTGCIVGSISAEGPDRNSWFVMSIEVRRPSLSWLSAALSDVFKS